MSRPLRIELDDAVYQVMARGNARDRIFFDDQDRQTFLGNRPPQPIYSRAAGCG